MWHCDSNIDGIFKLMPVLILEVWVFNRSLRKSPNKVFTVRNVEFSLC